MIIYISHSSRRKEALLHAPRAAKIITTSRQHFSILVLALYAQRIKKAVSATLDGVEPETKKCEAWIKPASGQ